MRDHTERQSEHLRHLFVEHSSLAKPSNLHGSRPGDADRQPRGRVHQPHRTTCQAPRAARPRARGCGRPAHPAASPAPRRPPLRCVEHSLRGRRMRGTPVQCCDDPRAQRRAALGLRRPFPRRALVRGRPDRDGLAGLAGTGEAAHRSLPASTSSRSRAYTTFGVYGWPTPSMVTVSAPSISR
jgi:hypothetical protein